MSMKEVTFFGVPGFMRSFRTI